MRDRVDASTCSPLPSSGYRGRPFREPCGFPPSAVLWGRTTARLPFPAASSLPWWQVLLVEGLFASRGTPSLPSGPGSIRVGLNLVALFGRGRVAEQSSKRSIRQPFRGRLIRLVWMSEEDVQSLHRGSGGSMYTRKAHATREAPRRGQG
jgi:hypothetical protein